MENLDYIKTKRIIAYYLYGQNTVEMNNPPIKEDLIKAIKHKEYLNKIDFNEFKKEVVKKIEREIEYIQKTMIPNFEALKAEQNFADFKIKIKPSSEEQKSIMTFEVPLEVKNKNMQKIFTKVAQAIKKIKNENNLC